jgi:ubiquitin carboxyl-terminal hydrolase 10
MPVKVVEEVTTEKSSPSPKPVIPDKGEVVVSEASEPKSWASLFKKDVPVAAVFPDKPTARVEPFTTSIEDAVVKVNAAAVVQRPLVDRRTMQLAEHLANYELLTTPLPLLPRGLINKSNWCYINATLQALIACPSFVHLVKSLVPYCGGKTEDFATPIIDSV